MIVKHTLKFFLFILCLYLVGADRACSEIELPMSPLEQPVFLAGDDFDFDEFDDEQDKAGDKDKDKEKTESSDTRIQKPAGGVSTTKAVFLSLLVPGAGQFYIHREGRGQLFLGAEVAVWLGYFGFHTYGNWKEDDYKNFAIKYAGIDPAGKDDDFYRNLIFYDSRDQYNREGRIINVGAPYYPNTPEYDWYWENSEAREKYRSMRNASETAFRKATFMLGVAVFNRIISGIDAFRSARKVKQRQEDEDFFSRHNIDIDFDSSLFGDNPRVELTVTHKF